MTSEPAACPTPLAKQLLAWYDRHRRTLPWRARPDESADPYRVWLSEIMLQQTTVAVVERYFRKFLQRWPTVGLLAAAPLDDVLAAWAGLGYYARARNLHACARTIVERHGGCFPADAAALRKLPGIGAYTAGAIAAIAFGERAAAIDANAERVIARLFGVETPLPSGKREIVDRAEPLVPSGRPGDFAQALMDLGATLCTPSKPQCLICPWSEACEGRLRGIAESLPRKVEKPERPTRRGAAFWVERPDGAILLRRRPERGLLGGMLEVPSTKWLAAGPAEPLRDAPVSAAWVKVAGQVEHTFTHFHLVLEVWRTSEPYDGPLPEGQDYRCVHASELPGAALPSVMRKIVEHVAGRNAGLSPPRRAASRR